MHGYAALFHWDRTADFTAMARQLIFRISIGVRAITAMGRSRGNLVMENLARFLTTLPRSISS